MFFGYYIVIATLGISNMFAFIPTSIRTIPPNKLSSSLLGTTTKTPSDALSPDNITPKSVTSEIMSFFNEKNGNKLDEKFKKRLLNEEVKKNIDGLHIITVLFQSARSKRLAKDIIPLKFLLERLSSWNREWSERDISMFVYGVRSLEGLEKVEGDILRLGAKKISESSASLTSRAIGNALYGLQDITSGTDGAPELCGALADKIDQYNGDLNGQDIGTSLFVSLIPNYSCR